MSDANALKYSHMRSSFKRSIAWRSASMLCFVYTPVAADHSATFVHKHEACLQVGRLDSTLHTSHITSVAGDCGLKIVVKLVNRSIFYLACISLCCWLATMASKIAV